MNGPGTVPRDPRRFPYLTTFYYGPRESFPTTGRCKDLARHWVPGDLAIEVQHANLAGAQVELVADVEVWERGPDGTWAEVVPGAGT